MNAKSRAPQYVVIFDMDGVLVDSEVHWKAVGSGFLRQMVPHWNDELQRSIHGLSLYMVYEVLVAEHMLTSSIEEFLQKYQELAEDIYLKKTSLISGSHDCLQRLYEASIPLALASSAPSAWIKMVVDRFTFSDYFIEVVSSDDVDMNPKPAPDVYIHTMKVIQRRYDVQNVKAIAIEDTEKGVRSAKSAGLKCIALRNGFNDHQDLAGADLVVESLDEISVATLEGIL